MAIPFCPFLFFFSFFLTLIHLGTEKVVAISSIIGVSNNTPIAVKASSCILLVEFFEKWNLRKNGKIEISFEQGRINMVSEYEF